MFLVHCWNVRFARTTSLHWYGSLCCIKCSDSTQQEKQYITLSYTGAASNKQNNDAGNVVVSKSSLNPPEADYVILRDVATTFASLISVVATRRGVNPLLCKLTFAERTSPNCRKYSRNAHKPDLPKMEQLGIVRPALSGTYFPRRGILHYAFTS